MTEPDEERLSAHYWPNGPVEIFDIDDPNSMPVVSTSYDVSVPSLDEADAFLRDSRFRRTEPWDDELDGYHAARVEFLGWEDDQPTDSGVEATRLIDIATPDGGNCGPMSLGQTQTSNAAPDRATGIELD